MSDDVWQPVTVTCYSGRTFAERPVSFTWENVEHKVKQIEKEWREPGLKRFRVRTGDDKLFDLRYNEQNDSWSAREIGENT